MKLQIFSDLHLEGYHSPSVVWKFVNPVAPIAVVAGDIHSRRFEESVEEIATKFEHVVCVLGNHEFYHRDISWRPKKILMPSNVHVLDRSTVTIEDTLFVGCTLWSDFNNQETTLMHAAHDMINDFRLIGKSGTRFTPLNAHELHLKDYQYLKTIIEQNRGQKLVVVTHFMPSYDCVHEQWKTPQTELLNKYFSANCDELIRISEAKAWIFGHTHDYRDLELYGVPLLCNPLGYYGERRDFKEMVVEL